MAQSCRLIYVSPISAMTKNHRTILVLLASLIVAGAVFCHEREMRRFRTAIAEITKIQSDGAPAMSTDIGPLPGDIGEVRRQAAELDRLKAEIAQLRREKVEMSELQANINKLAAEVSALSENYRSLGIIGGFNRPASNVSLAVSKAISLAQSSPAEAARWVAALPAGEEQNQAAMAVIERWIGSDPLAAGNWATQFAEGPLRQQALSLIARQWGLSDWNATAGWLGTLPTGLSRDTAIGSFVMSADGKDIQLALEWANRIEDSKGRASQVEATAQRWLKENNPAARAWIENAQLPDGMAERLLSAK